MTRDLSRLIRRYMTITVIALVPVAILCAFVTNLLVPTSPLPRPASAATYNIVETAAITEESTTIGIADSDLYNRSEEEILASLDEMLALGVSTVRVVVPWSAIQPAEPGSALEELYPADWEKIDFILSAAEERNMSVLAVLNATPYYGGQDDTGCLGCVGVAPDATEFAAFAGEVAARFESMFPGVVSAYEVWNEPNAATSWSPSVDPAAYTEVLKAVYTAIKDANGIAGADPTDPLVVAGVLGAVITVGDLTMDPVTFVEEMYANGAQGYFDALSYHPYDFDVELSEQNPNYLSPIQTLLEMRQTMLDNGDDAIKIWATEYGLPTSMVSYEEQADFIEDFLTTWANGLSDEQLSQLPEEYQELAESWEEWIGPAFIYSLRDRLGEEDTLEGSFGIYYYDEETGEWEMKPAAQVIKDLIDQLPSDDGGETVTASLQELIQQVINAFASAIQHVVSTVTQSVQQVATQIGNALANALAAWSALFTTRTTTTVAAVEAIDTAAVAEQAVADAVTPAEATPATETPTDVGNAQENMPVTATPAETPEEQASIATSVVAVDEVEAAEETVYSSTSTETAVADEPETTDEPKAIPPVNRQESENESTKDTDQTNSDKEADDDQDADREAAGDEDTKGTVKKGTSVNETTAKLGEDTTTTGTTSTAGQSTSEDASSSTEA
jgi:polysaccharide biosynthesis protein PslG